MKIGILGGGQLAKMLSESAKKIGIETICIDPDINCCAKLVTNVHHCDLSDTHQIEKVFADVDYITYETENVDVRSIEELSHQHQLNPNIDALRVTQDRLYEKRLFTALDIPTPAYIPIDTLDDLHKAVNEIGYPCVLKTRRNGYDGKGQAVIKSMDDVKTSWGALPRTELILEKFIPYDFEVSIISVRDKNGDIAFYPLTLNQHQEGILRISQAPFQDKNLENAARRYTANILKKFNYIGVMTIEFFCLDGALLANEIAPRVHNSGHWTIEGADTSQFENHLRAIAGLPLGSTNTTVCSAMINCISNEPENLSELLKIEGLYFHSYGKAARKNRKLGHITLCAKEVDSLRANIEKVFALRQ